MTTSRTAWARRKTRASFVCLSTVSQVGRAGSGNWRCSVRIGVLFHLNYYENYENAIVCPEIVRIPPYRSNIFSTQTFQELLQEGSTMKIRRFAKHSVAGVLVLMSFASSPVLAQSAHSHAAAAQASAATQHH